MDDLTPRRGVRATLIITDPDYPDGFRSIDVKVDSWLLDHLLEDYSYVRDAVLWPLTPDGEHRPRSCQVCGCRFEIPFDPTVPGTMTDDAPRVCPACLPLLPPPPRKEPRPTIPVALRLMVLERDRYRCVECEATDDLTLDHIHPYSKGGPDTFENLRILCRSCNSRKKDRV